MNLAIRGIEAHVESGDSFRNDRHPDLKADYILANPPFNVSDWQGEQLRQDKRWEYGTPRWGTPTLLGCSISFTTCLRGELPGSCWPTGPCLLTLREKGKFGRTSWKLTWWIASSHSPDSYSDRPRYRPASGFCAEDDRNGGARPGSSMSAGWATWSTEAGDYADIPGFWRKSRSTDTSSHPDVMLGQRLRRTTGNLLRRRWLCSLPSGGNSRQRRSSWTPRFSPPGVVGVGDAP